MGGNEVIWISYCELGDGREGRWVGGWVGRWVGGIGTLMPRMRLFSRSMASWAMRCMQSWTMAESSRWTWVGRWVGGWVCMDKKIEGKEKV